MLSARNLEVVYDDVVLALRGVSIDVPDGKIVALLGFQRRRQDDAAARAHRAARHPRRRVTKGASPSTTRRSTAAPEQIVRQGVRQVLEGRRVFVELSVEENLKVGAHTARPQMAENLDRVFGLFPVLADRRSRPPATSPAASSRCSRWAGR